MKLNNVFLPVLMVVLLSFLSGCGPKEIESDMALLSDESKEWIPFAGDETVQFVSDGDTLSFSGTGITTYFDKVRYKSDQSGFFSVQEDYYASMERQELIFESSSSSYFIKYLLEKNMAETGEWEMIHISLGDGDYYNNEIRVVIRETDNFAKSESYSYKSTLTLNGVAFQDVYYLKQERRPFELYYTKSLGIIGFKLSANELYTINY